MILDKSMAFLIFSIVVALVALAFFLSTFLPWHSDLLTVHQTESISAVNDTATPASETTEAPPLSYLTQPTSEKGDTDDIAKHRAPEDDQPSDILTEIEVLALIEEMEKEKTQLHQAHERKHELMMLLQDQMFALDDEFQAEFNENLRERQALTKDFEHNELNGASLDETSRTATPEELEELASRPGARSLLEALLQEKAIGKQWAAQSKALADEGNALTAEYAAIYQQILAIDKSIAELKSMLP